MEDSPHHVAITHEMFQHAAAEGQKEAKQIVHWGSQQNMPQLNPEAGVHTFQLVGPETSREELQELYLEVYKLHQLPRSPPGEPALLEEVLSSLEDHQGWRTEEAPTATVRPHPEDPHSSRSGVSQKGKKDSSVERSLPTIHEAHQKALAMEATLKEEIERLSHTQNHPETRVRSKSRDCWGGVEKSRRGDAARCGLGTPLPPTALLTQRQDLGKKEPPAKALI